MEDHTILLTVLEWAWIGLIAVVMYLFKRQNRIEKDLQERRGLVNTEVAVLKTMLNSHRAQCEKDNERNTTDHEMIIERIDTHHERTMARLDSLLKIAKNGN
jgi:hypothetical protein